ncbi:hypothetical protein [Pseudomonas aeruginosa]|uniref:hypothetical protein n=1 Tax=Pseudomonas aeruginosa TaxID=287 RepID=UPI003D05E230
MTESKICTCPSGDGSLRWPCPKHPAVEQAGGDERAACNLWIAEQQLCQGSDISLFKLERNGALVSLRDLLRDAYQAGQARAALAQPSPVRSSLLINGYQLRAALDFIAPDGTAEQLESETCIEWRQQDADFLEAGLYAFCAEYPEEGGVLLDEEPTTAQPSPLQSEQAEAERPEVVAYLFVKPDGTLSMDAVRHKPSQPAVAVMTVAQHDRIVGALRDELEAERKRVNIYVNNNRIRQDNERLRAELRAALARVEELERKLRDEENAHTTTIEQRDNAEHWADQLAKAIAERFGVDIGEHSNLNCPWNEALVWMQQPPTQAQHSVPGDIMRDAQRYRWLRDQQFYFSFSTENSDAGISSCTAGMSSRFKNLSWVDAAIDSAIAAAPGKEGV